MTRRTGLLLVALVGALLPLAPAAPAGAAPARTFTTNVADPRGDAAPGDGTCATAGGGCSLQAAFDEAIALRKGTILIGLHPGHAISAAVRGSITVRGGSRELFIDSLVVERGATLRIEDAQVSDGLITARGRLVTERSDVLSPKRLRVDPSGTLVLSSAFAILSHAGVHNLGRFEASYSTLRLPNRSEATDRLIQTSAEGVSTLLASNLMGPQGIGRACGGRTPVSQGYNLAYDSTCRLTHPTDLGRYVSGPSEIGPEGTPRLDAVPAGEAGCGTTFVLDRYRNPRPADGDGDGTAACDIGFIERQPR